jgi:transposase
MRFRQTVSNDGTRQSTSREPDPQVIPKAKRRTFSDEYKMRILDEVDACTKHGAIGALLRREGLYSSHISTWRQQRAQGGLEGRKRGRKPDPQAAESARLQRENERLRSRLERAEHIIDVQKKLAYLLGTPLVESPETENP